MDIDIERAIEERQEDEEIEGRIDKEIKRQIQRSAIPSPGSVDSMLSHICYCLLLPSMPLQNVRQHWSLKV